MKISTQSQNLVDRFGVEKAFCMLREAGFEAIDWGLDNTWNFKEVVASETFEGLCLFEKPLPEILEYYQPQLDAMKENGLVFAQAHAPFSSYSPKNAGVIDYAIRIYCQVIRLCEAVGCPKVVIHGITKKPELRHLSNAEVKALNMHLYESLIPTLAECEHVTVCLENLFGKTDSLRSLDFFAGCCANPYEAVEWIDHLNELAGRRCFGLCLDTGHLHLVRVQFCDYLPILGDRICALHVNDNTQAFDAHLIPYAGSTPWVEFLKEMRAIGYSGDINFEIFAQFRKNRLPEALVPTFLRAAAEIGAYFRDEIQA